MQPTNVRQFEDTSVLTHQTTENGTAKMPLNNICTHNVQTPTTFLRRVLGSRLIAAVHIQVATFRVTRDRRTRCFAAPWPQRPRQRHRRTGYRQRHNLGFSGCTRSKAKRWGFRHRPIFSCQSHSIVSNTTPQVVQETLELFQGEHVPACQRDSCARKCVRQ